ncbi:hypothetical protein E1265_03710 [Streptomyces sp. 8K308]|uniref:DUF5709 domain-containing protein n=1 Tax=Streptomyces sp. 8K308 TaxID=2530388 RepID=UPI0010507B45|nr:DUF5709 domain-containing protein [Streptomyces sp. 8K308]TDC26675.1 hypothetical protein E1265_03710 [Streptomyces sp. 8K308]
MSSTPEDEMGDEVYQPPRADDDQDDNPVDVDLDNALDEPQQDETLDQGYSPPERPFAASRYGTTAREQHDRESLDQRLNEELPEVAEPEGDGIGDQPGMAGEPVDDEVGDARAGRLVKVDERYPLRGGDGPSAQDMGIDGGAASAEEAAVHVIAELGPEQSPEEGD